LFDEGLVDFVADWGVAYVAFLICVEAEDSESDAYGKVFTCRVTN
jgi:hypothetical protein